MTEPQQATNYPIKGTTVEFEHPRLVTITADALHARMWGDTGAPIRAVWRQGRRAWVRGWISAEPIDGNPIWLITGKGERRDLRWRIWSGGTDYPVGED